MTLNKLKKIIDGLIAEGHGRRLVCINKDTFTHPLEGDGCVILPIDRVIVDSVLQIDDDGGTKELADGSEAYRINVIMVGDDYEPQPPSEEGE